MRRQLLERIAPSGGGRVARPQATLATARIPAISKRRAAIRRGGQGLLCTLQQLLGQLGGPQVQGAQGACQRQQQQDEEGVQQQGDDAANARSFG